MSEPAAKLSNDAPRKRLGRGLASLIGDIDRPSDASVSAPRPDGRVPIDALRPNPRNPRKRFGEGELESLSQSVRSHGVVQPVVVRRSPSDPQTYEIIAGERRWRAARQVGLTEIPIILRDVDDRTALELAIVENVQRADLDPIEEAEGYAMLVEHHGYTQADLADTLGRSRSHVTNMLRLLKLPEAVRRMTSDGVLSAGHARALVAAADPERLAATVEARQLSVRQTEELVARQGQSAGEGSEEANAPSRRRRKDAETKALEERLAERLGLPVTIRLDGSGGQIRLDYQTLDQLDEICRRLSNM